MEKVEEERCGHGVQVRVTDHRDLSKATINIWTCRHHACVHTAYHLVDDAKKKPIIVPLAPV